VDSHDGQELLALLERQISQIVAVHVQQIEDEVDDVLVLARAERVLQALEIADPVLGPAPRFSPVEQELRAQPLELAAQRRHARRPIETAARAESNSAF
jgi:hypothetical protein